MEQTKPIGTAATPAEKLVDTIIKGIQEKKGQDITVVDLRGIDGAIASFFVI